ncbi:hypothetical protein [Nostoc sp.]|uniref:hypothetical protein n=1 Tax=Nostoc sp. TaxID=1180 RepID=UPI002FF9BFAB
MRFGQPHQFLEKDDVRLASINRAIAQFKFSAEQLKEPYLHRVDEHTVLFIKGFGNEINLLSAFRDIYFNSRELLDLLLGRISQQTASSGNQTPKDFLPFAKRLMRGDFDNFNLEIISFLKTNINYIFHLRKIRNEIKKNPSSVEFLFNTDHFEARMSLPIDKSDYELLEHLDIANLDAAKMKFSYACVINLDIAFPEMLEFWKAAFEIQQR